MGCVRAVVSGPAHCLLGRLVSMVVGWQAVEDPGRGPSGRPPPQSVLSRVPREWNYQPREARRKESAARSTYGTGMKPSC